MRNNQQKGPSENIPEAPRRYNASIKAGDGRQDNNIDEPQIENNSMPHQMQAPPAAQRIPTPREIRKGLDEYVIGQSNVKVALSVGVYNHYKRISVVEAQARRAAGRLHDEHNVPDQQTS